MKAPKRSQKRKPHASPIRHHALWEGLGALSDATAFVEIAVKSLNGEDGQGGVELHVLEHGLAALHAAYTKLDSAISHQEKNHGKS